MNLLYLIVCRGVSTILIFTVASGLIILTVGTDVLEFSIHGVAWLIFALLFFAFITGKELLKGDYIFTYGKANFVLSATAASFLNSILNLVGVALSFFATAALVPDLASYPSAGGILVAAVICGIASATCDYVDEILKKIFTLKMIGA